MPDPFDPYREALVVEQSTLWSPEADARAEGWDRERRQRLGRALHADPSRATDLQYVRVHTGFCRQITVMPEDLDRSPATS